MIYAGDEPAEYRRISSGHPYSCGFALGAIIRQRVVRSSLTIVHLVEHDSHARCLHVM